MNDVTGDMYSYDVLTGVSETQDSSLFLSSTYNYIINGASDSFSSNSVRFGVTSGPAQFEFNQNSIVKTSNLISTPITSLNSRYAQYGDEKYALGDSVSAYIYSNGNYSSTSISSLISSDGYTIKGYYDKVISSGGRIRVIVAYAN